MKYWFLTALTVISLGIVGCDNDKGGGERVAATPPPTSGTTSQCQNATPGYNYGYSNYWYGSNGNQINCNNYSTYYDNYINNGLWASNNLNNCTIINGQQTYPLQIGGAWYCASYHYFMSNWGINPTTYYQNNSGFYFRTYYGYNGGYHNDCDGDDCYDGGDLLAAGLFGLALGYAVAH